jgi:hypothetical protein
VHTKPQPGLTGPVQGAVREGPLKHDIARFGLISDVRPAAEDRAYSVHSPSNLRALWDNPLNDEPYADANFLPDKSRVGIWETTP